MRRIIAALGAALLLCSPLRTAAADVPVEINAILPVTGSAAFIGSGFAQTLEILEKYINSTGGIHGRPLHFVIADDQSNPQVDVQLTNTLLAKHVPVILDGGPLAMCRATSSLYAANGPVIFCLSPAFLPSGNPWSFATGASSEDETRALINFMRLKQWKKIAVITANDATGQEAERTIKAILALPENRNEQIVDWEHFAPGDLSVAAQIAKIKEAGPDVLMAWGSGTPVATEYHGIKDAGLDIPVVGSNANQNYAQMEQWRDILPKHLYNYSLKWPLYQKLRPGPVKSAMAVVYSAFAAAKLRPDQGASNSWDPANIVVTALRNLPTDASAQQIRQYISEIHNFPGFNGFYDFRIGNQRGLTIKDCIVTLWDAKARTWLAVSGSGGAPL